MKQAIAIDMEGSRIIRTYFRNHQKNPSFKEINRSLDH